VSDASGMLLLNVPERSWSSEILDELDIDEELLPRCYESPEVTATVSEEAAEELGVSAGTPIVGGAGDQPASAVGNGIVRHGVISATLGTSGVVFAFSDSPATDPQGRVHTFCHAVPGEWQVMGVMLSAGGSFQWLRDRLGEAEREQAGREGRDSFDILTERAQQAVPGSEGLFFLPYLTGERTPHANPNAKGAWIGLTPRHGKPELVRSTMEGITFGMKDSLEIIRGMGVQVDEIRVSGGGAKSDFWCDMQADVYEQDVCTINTEQGPAYGVALLAGAGSGRWSSVQEACRSAIRVTDSYEVEESSADTYRRLYPIFRQLYRDLEDSFDDITEAVEDLYG
jgi:xylulokinase